MVADHKVCIIMLGESGVGKTSLMLRFCKNIFKEAQSYTSVDYYNKTILLNDKKIELQLWDTAGQERFKAIVKEYFRKADGVLLVYDTTNLETFKKLPSWLEDLRGVNEEATIVVVGNKADLTHPNHVTRSTAEKNTLKEDLDFCETSAKNNENVDEVFKNLVLKVLERKKISPFSKVLVNGEIKSENSSKSVTDSCKPASDSSTADSVSSTAASVSSTADFGNSKPASDNSKPASGNSKPPSGNSKPPSGSSKPASGSSKPASDNSKPASGNSKPASGNSKAASGSSKPQTENNSLPPIIRLEDDFGNDIQWIKLTVEKPKPKQKKCC